LEHARKLAREEMRGDEDTSDEGMPEDRAREFLRLVGRRKILEKKRETHTERETWANGFAIVYFSGNYILS